ncbi:MAG: LacI family transcriptional regulator [Cellulomonadaceae bacterium]|nr:LacI family transcriptional regulator [Cellulomonadaceae bacterium]
MSIVSPEFEAPKKVTIEDVARHAGVSVATVSKAVNRKYGVAKATIERVNEAVRELGYVPSMAASSMRNSASNVVGILLAGFDPFATEVIKGISAEAVNKDYELMAYSAAIADDKTVGWERDSLIRLGGTILDAAIVLTPSVALPEVAMPIVAIDPRMGPGGPPSIACDSLAGARAATQHLIDLGHTRIAHIRGRTDLTSALIREQGYCQAIAEAGLPYDPSMIVDGGYRRNWGADATRKLLALPEPPTAIFAANDSSALGVMDAAAEMGLSIPRDLSVVGFDDVPECMYATPALTTVAQPLMEMGAQAYRTILSMLGHEDVENSLKVPAELVVRGSTAPFVAAA